MKTITSLRPLDGAQFAADKISYNASAQATDPWQAGPQAVQITCTTAAYVKVGEGVTATTSDLPVTANIPVVVAVPAGSGAPWRVSAIRDASDGSLFAKPLNLE